MVPILEKVKLNNFMTKMTVYAPLIAKKALPGQFIILRVNEYGERIPLTIEDYNRENGTVSIVYQIVGKTTKLLDNLSKGDNILDFTGPLGNPSQIESYNKTVVIGGGAGCAIAYPQAKYLYGKNKFVDIIAGFRNKNLIILEKEMRAICNNLFLMTDDGSNGCKGFVTDALKKQIENNITYDLAIAIGPIPMMKAVCDLTKKYGIKTIVSMNPIMIDGTGMCGGCRVTVDGQTKFACVDGPDFDGHKVNFDEIMKRLNTYKKQEVNDFKHYCRLMGDIDNG